MSKIVLIFDAFWVRFWEPLWLPKCLPVGTPWATKIGQKVNRKLDCSKCHRKIAPRPPKIPLRASQDLPRPPPDHPKTPQNAPKRPKYPLRTLKNSAAGPWGRDHQACSASAVDEG